MEFINDSCKNGFTGEVGLGGMIPVTLCDERVACEISEDFTLPEYLPEIRRLLRVSGMATTPEKYVSPGGLRVSGAVEYCILYVGSDGRMYSSNFKDTYELTAPFDENIEWNENEGAFSDVFVCVDGTVGRVLGARKLNVRSRIVSDVKAIGTTEICGSGGCSERHMQRLIKSSDYTVEHFGESVESEAVDELELSNGDRYVCSSCWAAVDSTTAFSGYVECRGAVTMRHLIERQNGKLYDIVRKIPFSETINVDGAEAGMPVVARALCVGAVASVKENEGEGEADEVSVNVALGVFVRAYENRTLRYVKDGYSTEYKCENQMREVEIARLLATSSKNMTLSEMRDIDVLGASGDDVEICDVIARANAEGVALSASGRYVINGNCTFNVIYQKKLSDEREYSSAEIEIPFKYECSESGVLPDGKCIFVEAVEPRVRCDGKNADFGCELLISYSLVGEGMVRTVENSVLGECVEKKKSCYTVCYPSKQDSLWSISKRYGAAVATTAKNNGLDLTAEADTVGFEDELRYMIV